MLESYIALKEIVNQAINNWWSPRGYNNSLDDDSKIYKCHISEWEILLLYKNNYTHLESLHNLFSKDSWFMSFVKRKEKAFWFTKHWFGDVEPFRSNSWLTHSREMWVMDSNEKVKYVVENIIQENSPL